MMDDPGKGHEMPEDDLGRAGLGEVHKERKGRSNGQEAGGKGKSTFPKLTPIRFIEGEILPPRKWIVPDGWMPARKVKLIQGDGGDGKSTLLQQLQSSCATALPWIGLRVEECASVGFYTEEEEIDLKERQAWIDTAYGQHCASTGNLHLFPRADEENELVVFDRDGKPELTRFYHQVRQTVLDLRARLLVLDVAVDLFGGDEIRRREVRAFMRPLNKLAREIDGAVALTSHISQAGIRSDGGHSASTDWSNAGRSRLYLNRPKTESGEEIDANARLLARKKANYASIGDVIKLRWQNGLLVPSPLASPNFSRPSPYPPIERPMARAPLGERAYGALAGEERRGRVQLQPNNIAKME
jgi:RecA-family ATPase